MDRLVPVFVPLLLAVERMMARRIFVRMRREGQISRPILIVGTDADAVGLLHAAQSTPHLGYRVVGFVGPDEVGVRGVNVLGGTSRPRPCSNRPVPPAW